MALPTQPGTYYLRYYAVDHVGNVGEVKTDRVVIYRVPSLSISITDGKESADPGEMLTYHITYSNTGTIVATGVAVTDTLPTYTELISVTTPNYQRISNSMLRWSVGDLAPGEGGKDTVVVRVLDTDHFPGETMTLRNGVGIRCKEGYGSTAWDETLVQGLPLSLQLIVEPNSINLGQEVQIRCAWNRALGNGEIAVQPEGDRFVMTPLLSQRDSLFMYRPKIKGEHTVLFTGRDLTGGEANSSASFVVQLKEYFSIDRNRLELSRGDLASIRFSVKESQNVKIQIYNVAWELVEELYDQQAPLGQVNVSWDGEDASDRNVNSWLYLVKVNASEGAPLVKKPWVIREQR